MLICSCDASIVISIQLAIDVGTISVDRGDVVISAQARRDTIIVINRVYP